MADVDKDLEQELTDQIELLESLRVKVVDAIKDAIDKRELVRNGQSREDVFPPPT